MAEHKDSKSLVSGLLSCDARKILAEACEKMPELKQQVARRVTETSDPAVKAAKANLKKAFSSGVTRSLEWRRQQLRAMMAMLREGKDALLQGLKKDLNRSEEEGYFLETNIIEHAAQNALDNLDNWTSETRVSTNLINLPGASSLKSDPLGWCVLILGCWNYPVQLALVPLVGAIAAGNAVVLKLPTDMVPHSSNAMKRLCDQYLDRKYIMVMEGGVKTNQALLKERWDKVFYTGSDIVGRIVYEAAANHLTPVCLEMGGKCPTIIGKTSNLEVATKRIAWGKWMNAGQTCVAPDHIFVHKDISKQFREKLVKNVKDFYGHCHSSSRGDKIITGGNFDVKSRYIDPTVLFFGDDWKSFESSKAMSQEIFGPVLPVVEYTDAERVVEFINKGEKPLSLYVFSNDTRGYVEGMGGEEYLCLRASRKSFFLLEKEIFLKNTSSGAYLVNEIATHLTNEELPFGGVGHSGIASYHGKFSFDCFSHQKAVLRRPDTTVLDIFARYPPYSSLKVAILGFAQTVRPAWKFRVLKYAFFLVVTMVIVQNKSR
eukprot:jgi/Bigna1/80534/fgenesh1_pg.72_\